MNKNLLFILSFVILLGVFGFASAETITLPNPLCPAGAVGTPNCIDTLPRLIGRITDYIFTIIGVLAVLMFVISGIFFVLSAGQPEKIKRARDIAIYAAIGAGIALSGTGLAALVRAVIGA